MKNKKSAIEKKLTQKPEPPNRKVKFGDDEIGHDWYGEFQFEEKIDENESASFSKDVNDLYRKSDYFLVIGMTKDNEYSILSEGFTDEQLIVTLKVAIDEISGSVGKTD